MRCSVIFCLINRQFEMNDFDWYANDGAHDSDLRVYLLQLHPHFQLVLMARIHCNARFFQTIHNRLHIYMTYYSKPPLEQTLIFFNKLRARIFIMFVDRKNKRIYLIIYLIKNSHFWPQKISLGKKDVLAWKVIPVASTMPSTVIISSKSACLMLS